MFVIQSDNLQELLLQTNSAGWCHLANMTQIKTLVYLDLETTGLKSTVIRPRITELSLVAVSVRSVLGKNIH